MRYGVGCLAAFLCGFAAINLHSDEFGCTFAIAHDGLCQEPRHIKQCGFDGLPSRALQVGNGGVFGLVGGNNNE